MKKFLSLALALVMSLSLLTVGAGATEYKDLTDKNEIQYEEAVAVLNKLGIITGYEDGSFKPTGALTRGAAAKILVSMMIGSEAASNLTVAASPYKDVPVTNTFAAVISYCKTAGYINGYADGTFRPTAPLTGYAFSKMLLGALGYEGKTEGFTGTGWTMNVAKLGNKAGLFNDFAAAFKGNDGLNREAACLLALNTLKATEVEYDGNNVNISGDGINVSVGNTSYKYVTSNNKNINQNIGKNKDNQSSEYTLEFGEEHFPDLKLVSTNAADDFGRPANKWSYKNVAVGTYAKTADYTYTTAASGDTDADKVKDMGLKDYTVAASSYTVNGLETAFSGTNAQKLATIAGLTANGTQVQVYLSDDTADTITEVVVVKTQLMQVNSVKSSSVTLKKVDATQNKADISFMNVSEIKDDNDAYAAVKGLKTDDYVLVVPVKDGSSYKVESVTIPQSVTGKLTNIATKTNNTKVKGITVAGTAYAMSDMWTSEDGNLNVDTKLSNTVDTTVYLDSYGYAIFVKDVTSSNSAIIIDEIYSSLSDGKIVKYAKGWDTTGNALSLNLGTNPDLKGFTETTIQGKSFEYQTSTSNGADYALVANTVTWTKGSLVYASAANASVAAGASSASVGGKTVYFDSNVKFMFLSMDGADVTGVTVKEGVSEVTAVGASASLTYVLNKDGDKIVAVIVPNDDDAAISANLLYVEKVTDYRNNAENKRVAVFTAYINGEKKTGCEYTKETLDANKFYTYTEKNGIYTLSEYKKTDKATSIKINDTLLKADVLSDTYFTSEAPVNGGANAVLNAKNATIVDLYTDDGIDYSSLKDMRDALESGKVTNFKVSYIYNGSDSNGSATVAYMYILANDSIDTTVPPVSSDVIVKDNDASHNFAAPKYFVEAGTKTLTDDDIYAILVAGGCTSISKNGATWTFTKANGFTVTNQTITPVQVYKVTAPAAVAAAGNAGAYSATADVTYAASGATVTVTVKTVAAATANTDTITLTGVAGGNAAVGQAAAALNGTLTFTYTMGAADSLAVINVANA